MLVIVLTFSIDCGASPAGAIARGVYISYVTSETSIANAFEVHRRQDLTESVPVMPHAPAQSVVSNRLA